MLLQCYLGGEVSTVKLTIIYDHVLKSIIFKLLL